jgi:uncharacterized protein YabN with tetrapyrrole methylase and pyrophosphatase domain
MAEPLEQARLLQAAAALDGFDWPDTAGMWDKLAEEIAELRAAEPQGQARCADELGDVLFMVINLARHLRVDPAAALRAACAKFSARYAYVQAHAAGLPPRGSPERLQAMEILWQQAKLEER